MELEKFYLRQLFEAVKDIEIKNPGLLEVPDNKNFWELPISHYEKLVKAKGYQKIIQGLTNLERWNKKNHPDISKKASSIASKLKKKFRPKD